MIRSQFRVLRAAGALLVLCVTLAWSPASASASSRVCSNKAVSAFITRLAKKFDVRTPYVSEVSELTRPEYHFYDSEIATPRCATVNELYHEFGHHVMALAANADPAKFQEFAGGFREFKVWLKTSLDNDGFERGAHCIGYQLGGRGAYTRCPFKAARQLGSWMIGAARYFAPYDS